MNIKSHRPIGLVITTFVTFLVAIATAVFLVTIPGDLRHIDPLIGLLIVAILVICILWFVLSYGLWTFQPWAIKLGKLVYWISLILSFLNLFNDPTGSEFVVRLLGTAINASMLIYISRPEIADLYEHQDLMHAQCEDREGT